MKKIRTWQRWYAGTPFEYVEKYVPKSGLILDLGCGWGIFTVVLALKSEKRRVFGIDYDAEKIKWAKTAAESVPGVDFLCTDLQEAGLEQCDAIVIYDVLHHLPDITVDNIFDQARSKLKEGGLLIIKENDTFPLWKLVISYLVEWVALSFKITHSAKIRFRNQSEWQTLLENHSFRVEHCEHIRTWNGFFVPHSLFVARRS